jgi:hypothetical protein
MRNRSFATYPEQLQGELAALSALSVRQLKERWRSMYRTEPPHRISRELLTRALAYRLQERALGGLKPSTRRLLDRFGEGVSSHRLMWLARHRKTAPGTELVREWRGTSHRVTVLADGVIYREQRYGSLSEVARLITGTRWSGPRFFGLKQRTREASHG